MVREDCAWRIWGTIFRKIRLRSYREGRGAWTPPLKRNITIIENADIVLAFWDGVSRGTKHVIDNCKKRNIPVEIYILAE